MTTDTESLEARLAAMTCECPDCHYLGERVQEPQGCKKCKGTGLVARFPEFRQECGACVEGKVNCVGPACRVEHDCDFCNGTGWQVRAGGLEDGLEGLTVIEGMAVYERLQRDAKGEAETLRHPDDPMPSAPEILLKGLELVCEIAGLEVPDG